MDIESIKVLKSEMVKAKSAKENLNSTRLLIVDDEPAICEMVHQYFTSIGYDCFTSHCVKDALINLDSDSFDLVITDIKMPEYDGTYLLREIRNLFPDIAVIMMTGVEDTHQAVECLKIGAYDYISKPFNLEELNLSVKRAFERRNLLKEKKAYKNQLETKVHERTLELVRAYDEIERTYHRTLEVLVSALDLREKSTAGHSMRSVEYTRLLALELKIRGNKLVHITRGALLHDVGKIGIPDEILLKAGKLSDEEWEKMRKHPVYGYNMLREIKFLEKSIDIVLYHHERWDGKGYPKGLKGDEIPVGARIFAVIDAFDAITSNRVYRNAQSFDKAFEILVENIDTQFDRKIVNAFINIPFEKIQRVYQISILKDLDNFSTNNLKY